MKGLRKIIALLLCILMFIPTQALAALAEGMERIEETFPLEQIEGHETERIEETLPLEGLDEDNETERVEESLPLIPLEPEDAMDGEWVVYWNPEGVLPIASPSDAQKADKRRPARIATSSVANKGNDYADGRSPSSPVKTLAAALERVEELQEKMGIPASEITICAMSPMEIADGQLYVLNGGNVKITSWSGRSYESDVIFYVNGGQLTLRNVQLEAAGNPKTEESELVWVDGGVLQMGQNVEIAGQVILDYRLEEEVEWKEDSGYETATSSNAIKQKEGDGWFSLDNYILYEGDTYIELVQDYMEESIFRKPMIELIEGFEGSDSGYLLKLYSEGSMGSINLVETLYADALSTDEFQSMFALSEETDSDWRLTTYSQLQKSALVRDTGSIDLDRFNQLQTGESLDGEEEDDFKSERMLTVKVLQASRAGGTIYWNPGGTVQDELGVTYRAGDDLVHDGLSPQSATKSLGKAISLAGGGGTIIYMQGLNLARDITEYLNYSSGGESYDFLESDGSYLIKTPQNVPVRLVCWDSNNIPLFTIPDGKKLSLDTIVLEGKTLNRSVAGIVCEGGGVVEVRENVRAKSAYIQVNVNEKVRTVAPIRATSIEGEGDVILFFSGINDNLSYRYVDVVIPSGELAEELDDETEAILVGEALQKRFLLSAMNRDDLHEGKSRFDWELRPDTREDVDGYHPENLELYAEYFYDAIYVDGIRGDDTSLGATCHYPVKTWKRAYELWKAEMEKSIAKREAVFSDPQNILSEEEINRRYPVPDAIYVCGTVIADNVTVSGLEEEWKLDEYSCNGKPIKTEVVSHIQIPNKEDGSGLPAHDLPDVLFRVTDGKSITFTDMTIRNITNQKNLAGSKSITILADGGIVKLDGETVLTGELVSSDNTQAKAVTYGTHVYVDGTNQSSAIEMKESWTGSIERRQHGVIAEGQQAVVEMKGGSIRENNSYDSAYSNSSYTHERGAGVVVKSEASMNMSGGRIENNTVYQYGAGIYLEGAGTTLNLTGGMVTGNQMERKSDYGTAVTGTLHGYGIGIYGDVGTIMNLGSSGGNRDEVQISGNKGYLVSGAGIYSQGILNMEGVTVSNNLSEQYHNSTNTSLGIGIHISAGGILTMKDCLVSGNSTIRTTTSNSYYENAKGGGIYIYGNSGTEHSINNSEISKNRIGYSSSVSYGQGGGIYIEAGELNIDDGSVIEGNKAPYGGGIYATNTGTKVTIESSAVSDNLAHRAANTTQDGTLTSFNGYGGGIHLDNYTSLVLLGESKVEKNRAYYGGGIYTVGSSLTNGSKITMAGENEKENWVQIVGNIATYYGGGLYTSYATITGERVSITENRVNSYYGGGWYGNYGNHTLSDAELSGNYANNYGGGLYAYYGTYTLSDVTIHDNQSGSHGGGIFGSYMTCYLLNTTIDSNSTGSYGGGWYNSYGTVYATNLILNNNTSGGDGGGWYGTGTLYVSGLMINGNTAAGNGGGWYRAGSSYISGLTMNDNIATGNGGGLFSTGNIYLIEHAEIVDCVQGNTARNGGGIYQSSGLINMETPGLYQNEAQEQGSNLYLANTGTVNLFNGNFKQPVEPVESAYNIYVDRTAGGIQRLDLTKVQVEKKTGASPDVIYLNTGDSYLTYLQVPVGEERTFPIDVNQEVFSTGSVVIKPRLSNLTLYEYVLNMNAVTGIPSGASAKTYNIPNFLDATVNLEYSEGGKLPRRTHLGGFKASDGVTTNAVIVGEGIYLSSSGSDDNHGLDPDNAVATFGIAKEKLEQQIRAAAGDPGNTIGYSPFIYICGTVKLNRDETWSLNPDDDLYLEINKDYIDAEDEDAQPAQVRRFASFVNQPMIQVGETASDVVHFKANEILINGMLDAVITGDQGSQSPILKIMNESKATLSGKAQVYNNHEIGIALYGTLVLDGDEDEGDWNQQVMDHNGNYVQLFGTTGRVEMNGDSRILSSGSNDRIIKNSYGIYGASGASGTVLMKDSSQIEGNYGTTGAVGDLYAGIYFTSSNGLKVELENSAGLSNLKAYGIYSNGINNEIYMKNFSFMEGIRDYGIQISSNGTGANQVYLQDSSNINKAGTGIYATASTNGRSDIHMQNFSSLTECANYGVYLGSGPTGFYMNTNAGADEEDCAQITRAVKGGTAGVYLVGGSNTVVMAKQARIENYERGFHTNGSMTTGTAEILMQDDSSVRNCTYGYHNNDNISIPMLIYLKDQAAIEGCSSYGIAATSTSSNYNWKKLEIRMEDDARISGVGGYGLYFGNAYNWNAESYIRLNMSGNSIIGGEEPYQLENLSSGIKNTGIYSNAPMEINMSGESRISGCGSGSGNHNTNNTGINAIYLYRANYSYNKTSVITLTENASINGNKGSIYLPDSSSTSYPSNVCEVILDGTGANSRPSIENNTDGIWLGKEATLKLRGSAVVGATTYQVSDRTRSIIGYGSIELDGDSVVQGPIQMNNSGHPIIMTNKVSNPLQKYQLELVEEFMSHPVVSPGGAETDVSDQKPYFEKIYAHGLAADKELAGVAPHVVLLGENNVYLSGNGNDNNDGNSPSTPVRTFKRAKELLEGGDNGGYYEEGANIIICGTTVSIDTSADANWSFDAGGNVTNEKSGHTWKPLVIRYKDFTGNLISVTQSAGTVTFENITIDGGSKEGIVIAGGGNVLNHLLKVNTGGYAILGDGAVLQNNKCIIADSEYGNSQGVYVNGGTFEMDGGTIQGLERIATSYSTINTSYLPYSGLAVSCYNSTFIFKSGSIVDNFWSSTTLQSADIGLVYLGNGSTMEMRGGTITGNKILKRQSLNYMSSMIMVNNSQLEMSSGIIRDNIGGVGSAIGYKGTSTTINHGCILSGGQISNQQTAFNNVSISYEPLKEYSPIYVGGTDFQLKGGGANLSDSIYLYAPSNNIKLSGAIYQGGRRYTVYLNEGSGSSQFKKGSVVVQPDGSFVIDATPYMPNFEIRSTTYVVDFGQTKQLIAGSSTIRENECLLLMKAVYLDGIKGVDSNSGIRPKLAVKTFQQAKIRGQSGDGSQDYYIIYLSGPAIDTTVNVWSIPDTAYMCRYTGFAIYESDGTMVLPGAEERREYNGSLIIPNKDLVLDGISIYGRRSIDSVNQNGESLVQVNPGVKVTMRESNPDNQTLLARNQNTGVYMTWPPERPEGIEQNLSHKGGAFCVEPEGELEIEGGTIQQTEAVYGSAVYLGADEVDPNANGRLYLSNTPVIEGRVYLTGNGSTTASYVEPDYTYVPEKVANSTSDQTKYLSIDIGNDYNTRPVVQYRDGHVPDVDEIKYYQFADAIQAMYSIVYHESIEERLQLEIRQVLYLDGQNGSDEESGRDGSTPEKAFRSIRRVYEELSGESAQGTVVYVVDTVDIKDGEDISVINTLVAGQGDVKQHHEGLYSDNSGAEDVKISGQVYFKRYAQPDAYGSSDFPTGYDRPTLMGPLFKVCDGGKLELSGAYLDGHAQDSYGSYITLEATGVKAEGPLVAVEKSGVLNCEKKTFSSVVPNSLPTATLFSNNLNIKNKIGDTQFYLGTLGSVDIYEGSGAGIELWDGGICFLEGVEFTNLELGEGISGGTDVYSNGELHFQRQTHFTGSVFLEGLERYDPNPSATYDTSRYLTIDAYGVPMATDFQVLMRDPYNGRKVVWYSGGASDPLVNISEIRLEEVVKLYFHLTQRLGDPNTLELQIPTAVYIDGINGSDDPDNVAAGSTPKNPVKSLERAFSLLKTRGGNTIHVVDTVDIKVDTTISGNVYSGGETVYLNSTDRISMKRYVQPDFAIADAGEAQQSGYDVEDFQGSLLRVKDGVTLTLGDNFILDGHREVIEGDEYPKELIVTRTNLETKAPLLYVEKGANLNLNGGVKILDSQNIHSGADQEVEVGSTIKNLHGGAIRNLGTTTINRAEFLNIDAAKGGGIYQDGVFVINSGTEFLNSFEVYLTTVNTGTELDPVWGEDHIIQIAELLPEDMTGTSAFVLEMDHGVPGRTVVRFSDDTAFDPDADAEHEHFSLGESVPKTYFLVERKNDPMVLELQDWRVLDVEVPSDIYLVIQRRGSFDSTTKISGVVKEAAGDELLTSPDYTIVNNGRYDVKVSLHEFEKKTVPSESSLGAIQLKATAGDISGKSDLYLAIRGLGAGEGGANTGFVFSETSLKGYSDGSALADLELGTLEAGTSGRFTFTGAVGAGFMDHYLDLSFPLTTREEAQKHMDGRNGTIHARAKYELKYRLELVPSRRTPLTPPIP